MTPARMADIHAACFGDAPRPWRDDEFESYINGSAYVLWEADTALAVVQIIADEAELLTLAVDPMQQRTGLGRKLMARIETLARDHNCASIVLEVAETNTAARALYETFGFAEVGYRKNYYAPIGKTRLSALVLRRNLASNV